jgi:glycyl-tRNA synthetase beta subunit
VKAVVVQHWPFPRKALAMVEALAKVRSTPDFEALAMLFKRVKNITKESNVIPAWPAELKPRLREPAELALVEALERIEPAVQIATEQGRYVDAMREVASLWQSVDRFFIDVLVMTDDKELRDARLTLLTTLKDRIQFVSGDISEIAPEERQA